MYETLVTLFAGRVYFSDDFARELDLPYTEYVEAWHATEMDRTCGKMTLEEGVEIALRKVGRYTPEAVGLLMRKRHESQSDTFASVPPETFALLAELKKRGIKIGLISNCFSDERDMIRASSLLPYFDAVELSYEQGLRKPVLKLYTSIAEELGVKPEECLYIGDGGSKELQGAEKAGMTPVQANWFRHLAYEPHIPSRVYPEYAQADKQEDVLKFL